jgi:hypothetical protein
MSEGSRLVGRYGQSGTPGLAVGGREGALTLALPGAPDDTVCPLHAREPGAFVVESGPLRGLRLRFEGEGERARLEVAGLGRFPRHPDPDPPDYALGPEIPLDAARERAFAAAYARVAGTGGRIEPPPAYPRHELLDWLARREDVVLHGSNEPGIEEFEPRRRTLGPLARQSESGVSACSDALWAIAYAVLDRSRIRGAFHNGVVPLATAERTLRLYHFSVARDVLETRPFANGTVYALPRERFERVAPVGPASLEWVSPVAVRPLARVDVRPEDFPLLDRVRGHDDRRARRYLELRDRLLAECAEAEPLGDGYELRFDPREGLASDVSEWTAMQRAAFPWTQCEVRAAPEGDRIVLRLTGATGLRDFLARALEQVRRR